MGNNATKIVVTKKRGPCASNAIAKMNTMIITAIVTLVAITMLTYVASIGTPNAHFEGCLEFISFGHVMVRYVRKEPIRFDSFWFRTFRQFIGSVRFGSELIFPASMRFGLRFSDASWLGPVRFGSAPGSGRF